MTLYLSHNQGGHQQVDARIAYNEIDLVLLFTDPNNSDPWEDQQVVQTLHLCGELRADCAAANSHYKKVEDQKVSQVTDKIYNSYLQTVGVESGRQSYGEVVDLLTAWYFSQEATQ